MRRFRRGGAGEGAAAAVDLSAMIDMVFLLLIFFVVTTSFTRETGVRVKRPESARALGVGARYLPVAVTRAGTVHAGGRALAVDDRAGLAAALAAAGTRHVVIQADRMAPTGLTLAVQDLALSAGATRVDVAAVRR
ncbi:MAG: biopolymer transporter ExbD [bacterium]|nr:biopolymer transporter ExbD [Myxococcales bacterium]MCB9552270.1 biopolymer transporter ExbD [Myxococcales bacterium]